MGCTRSATPKIAVCSAIYRSIAACARACGCAHLVMVVRIEVVLVVRVALKIGHLREVSREARHLVLQPASRGVHAESACHLMNAASMRHPTSTHFISTSSPTFSSLCL